MCWCHEDNSYEKIRDKFIIALQLQKKTSNWISRYFKSTILYQAHITKFPLMIGKIWIKSWSVFLVSYYHIPSLLLLSNVDLIHQNEKMREFLKFKATQTTSLLLLCDFFVVSQWRSFIKWQRIFRFFAELLKREFYDLPPCIVIGRLVW